MVDTEPCEFPKWNELPRWRRRALALHRRLIIQIGADPVGGGGARDPVGCDWPASR